MKSMKNLLSAALVSQLLSVCTAYGQQAPVKRPVALPKNTISTTLPKNLKQPTLPKTFKQFRGTGDGGGGNAINYKMLESYIIDPRELEVVKSLVAPILNKVIYDEDTKQELDMFILKNWYLAPITLNAIPKDVLGIEFTADGHQQVAIQTDSAIWIDSTIFNKMTPNEQARLIVHEVLMSIYLTRFQTMNELCAGINKMYADGCRSLSSKELDAMNETYLPQPKRPLEFKDYEAIRAATAWLFQNKSTATNKAFEEYLKKINFADPRFKTSAEYNSKNDLELSITDVELSLRAAKLSGALVKQCQLVNLRTQVACDLNWTVGKDRIVINIIDSSTNQTVQSGTLYFADGKTTAYVNDSGNMLTAVPSFLSSVELTPGMTGSALALNFKKEHTTIQLSSIGSIPLVFVGQNTTLREYEVDGLKRKHSCVVNRLERLNAQDMSTDALIMKTVGAGKTELLAFVKTFHFNDSICQDVSVE